MYLSEMLTEQNITSFILFRIYPCPPPPSYRVLGRYGLVVPMCLPKTCALGIIFSSSSETHKYLINTLILLLFWHWEKGREGEGKLSIIQLAPVPKEANTDVRAQIL